ncbi:MULTISPECIES: FAD-binding oxidoreductase [unclassified Caballeronia]|uniref:FAD-binding oxidoreductase n=1 Tax=unclassified Caballeronia TaxID=2646786 RepID=UPI0028608D90|nr:MULTISPECIES: FAD-binding oxidoreductase [unclassified Caballeronia]MDR5753852.1 FAD-binding oxidoreductase [Caballeronia sp. LZ024]MDR5840231.1 FAD-binding oxidoreductase [Caballeronia sp. LZ031]
MSAPLDATIAALREALGDDRVRVGEAIGERSMTDWTGYAPARPAALVLPRSTDEVSRALAICNEARQSVVPQGGMTGLAGGAIARPADIAISLERLAGIEEIDAASATMTVLAGTTLQTAQEAAAAAGFELGLDLGARGSCQIGGNLATNAGGNRVIQSGTAREQVLGLEAVLANGAVLSSMNKMIKNNTGYDLKQLFVGSEGTLGVITRAVLRLHPPRAGRHTALVALDGYDQVVALLRTLSARFGNDIGAFEIMWPDFFDFGVSLTSSARSPFAAPHPLYALIEHAGFDADDDGERFAAALADAFDAGAVRDAIVAQSVADARALWQVRECTAEFPARLDPVNFDVSLPIGSIGQFVAECRAALDARWPSNRSYYFGHIGDSNLHVTVDGHSVPGVPHHEVYAFVYDMVVPYRGSVSAEHGIGLLKREFLPLSRSPEEIAAMTAIKRALDPNGILNPGKLI